MQHIKLTRLHCREGLHVEHIDKTKMLWDQGAPLLDRVALLAQPASAKPAAGKFVLRQSRVLLAGSDFARRGS